MPLLDRPDFQPPIYFRSPHLQTIYPALLRRVSGITYNRQRLELPDGDFVDLDWSKVGSKRLIIVLHGLEGDASRPYVLGQVRRFNAGGWDAIGWNFRGCSGEPNRKLQSYHSGATADLAYVMNWIANNLDYEQVVILGFSLGGNVTLKYLGEQGEALPSIVQAGVAFSVPCDLASAGVKLRKWYNRLYMDRFMRNLKDKIRLKEHLVDEQVDLELVYQARNFTDFDAAFTAPVHGFTSAEDYWKRASSKPLLSKIRVPTILINAFDDSFLSKDCYPVAIAEKSKWLHLEIPRYGGHVGFVKSDDTGYYWSEQRAYRFVEEVLAHEISA